MHLLVTGATGLLGNNLVRMLLERGDRVRVLTRKSSDSKPLAGLAIDAAEGDIREAESVAAACRGVDAVIHSAGYVNIGWSQGELYQAINVEGTRNVAQAAREAGVRLVHVSSVDALGLGTLEKPADEETAPEGILEIPYVVTKREAERVVQQEIARGLNATIVNPGYMLGPWDWKPSSGRLLLNVASRWVPMAPIGGNNFVDVRDVARGTLTALERGQVGRRYILGGENLDYFSVFQHFAQLGGRSGPWGRMGPMARWIVANAGDLWYRLTGHEPDINSGAVYSSKDPHYFSSARAEQELDYQHRPFKDAVRDAWEWFGSNGYR